MEALSNSIRVASWPFKDDNRERIRRQLAQVKDHKHVHKVNLRLKCYANVDGQRVTRDVGTQNYNHTRKIGVLNRRLRRRPAGNPCGTALRVDPRCTGSALTNAAFNATMRDRVLNDLDGKMQAMVNAIGDVYGGGMDWHVDTVTIGLYRARGMRLNPRKRKGGAYAPLPKELEKRYCVRNLHVDEHCFAYCIAAHLHRPARNPNRLSHYTRILFPAEGPRYPLIPPVVDVKDIPRIEREYGLLVNVYAVASDIKSYTPFLVYPDERGAANRDPAAIIPLLLHEKHYSLITNFPQFATRQGNPACFACLTPLTEPHADHAARCSKFPPITMLAAKTPALKYTPATPPNTVITADFEAMLQGEAHIPCAWAMQVIGGALHEGFGPSTVADFIEAVMSYASPLTVCLFHNLKGYDSHHILRHLADRGSPYRVEILPQTCEKIVSMTIFRGKDRVRFIDSMGLMNDSLDNLLTMAGLGNKLYYPYEYFCSWDKYLETAMPPIEAFYSALTEKDVTSEQYAEAAALFDGCENLQEYTMLYVRRDVVGLAEVLTRFRTLMLESHGIDPCAYFSLPGASWAAMLKITKTELDTVPPEMYQWLESGVRGGLAVASRHYADSASGSITYFDANNLYGWAMSQPLPLGGYEWVHERVDLDGYGHILEVDLEYPEALHSHAAHRQLPLAPDFRECPDGFIKLCGTFEPKERYVLHDRALDYYVAKGLVVTKVHRIMRFRQRAWLKPYIDLNSSLRAASTNTFDSNLYKLMNNAVYGKTLESTRNRCKVRTFTDRDKFEAFVSKPEFVSATPLGPHMVQATAARTFMRCDKVPAVGVTILDLSKLHMAQWHHDTVLAKLPSAELCATDTDSFMYWVPGSTDEQVYDALKENLDTSNFPPEHPLYHTRHKKVPGYFKSECPPPDSIREGVFLRAKLYSLDIRHTCGPKCDSPCSHHSVQKAKGVKTGYVRNHITHADYMQCFHTREDLVTKPHQKISAFKHNIVTETFTKVGLSARDDKRVQIDDIRTVPYK
tara:strand:+ start:307 stop:3366 length:3060 start_codon:yes stop_codon:yes gene_type:complete